MWQDATHRAAKVHVAFAVWPGTPVRATVTVGNGSERDELRRMAEPGGFHVMDRGSVEYDLLRELDAGNSRFVQRLADNAVYEVASETPLTVADRRSGVVRDVAVDSAWRVGSTCRTARVESCEPRASNRRELAAGDQRGDVAGRVGGAGVPSRRANGCGN